MRSAAGAGVFEEEAAVQKVARTPTVQSDGHAC